MSWTVGQAESYGFFGQGFFGLGLLEQQATEGGAGGGVHHLNERVTMRAQQNLERVRREARRARQEEEDLILALLMED